MIGLRHATALTAVVALLLDAHTSVWAQGSNKRTDTFEQRYPPGQVPTPPAGEEAPPRQPPVRQAPTQPPGDQFRARPSPRETEKNSSPGGRATQEARYGYHGAARRQRETLQIACCGPATIVLGRRHRGATRRPQVPRLRIASIAHSHRRGHQYGRTRRVA
jgi:hypothetical protein